MSSGKWIPNMLKPRLYMIISNTFAILILSTLNHPASNKLYTELTKCHNTQDPSVPPSGALCALHLACRVFQKWLNFQSKSLVTTTLTYIAVSVFSTLVTMAANKPTTCMFMTTSCIFTYSTVNRIHKMIYNQSTIIPNLQYHFKILIL